MIRNSSKHKKYHSQKKINLFLFHQKASEAPTTPVWHGSYLIPSSSSLDVLALVKILSYIFSEPCIPKVWGPAFSLVTDSKPNWYHIPKLSSSSCYQDISHWVRDHSYNGLSANWESKVVSIAGKDVLNKLTCYTTKLQKFSVEICHHILSLSGCVMSAQI